MALPLYSPASCLPAAPGWPEALAVDGARKMGAEEAKSCREGGRGTLPRQEEEEMAGAQVLFRGGKSREPEQGGAALQGVGGRQAMEQDGPAGQGADGREAGGRKKRRTPPLHEASFQARRGSGAPGCSCGVRGWRPNSREDSVRPGSAPPGCARPRGEEGEEGGQLTAGQRLVWGGSQPWALLWAAAPRRAALHHRGDTVPLESGLERRLTGGAQETGKAKEKRRVGEEAPRKAGRQQTGDKKHSDQHTEAEELASKADPRGPGRDLCPKGVGASAGLEVGQEWMDVAWSFK